jgi:hypothetical protein
MNCRKRLSAKDLRQADPPRRDVTPLPTRTYDYFGHMSFFCGVWGGQTPIIHYNGGSKRHNTNERAEEC